MWLEDLHGRFEESLHGPKPYADALAFQRSMLVALSEVQKRNAGIQPFRDIFYEFLGNWEQPVYQSLWHFLWRWPQRRTQTPSACSSI